MGIKWMVSGSVKVKLPASKEIKAHKKKKKLLGLFLIPFSEQMKQRVNRKFFRGAVSNFGLRDH